MADVMKINFIKQKKEILSLFLSWGVASTVIHNSDRPQVGKLLGPAGFKFCSYREMFCRCGIKGYKALVYYKKLNEGE